MTESYSSLLIVLPLFFMSLGIALFVMKAIDNAKGQLAARKAIGEESDHDPYMDALAVLLKVLNFNQQETKEKLVKAGIYSNVIANVYYLIKIVPFVVCLCVAIFLLIAEFFDISMFVVVVALSAIVFLIAPDAYVASRGNRITRKISNRLPFLLDLMNVCVHTGMTIEASLEYLAKELRTVDKHLAYVLKKTLERAQLVGIERALEDFYTFVPTAETQSVVMTLTQSLKYGSSVGPVLGTLACDIRELSMMDLEEKIGKMGAKMSIPLIAFIMVPIIVLIAAPGIMRMLA